LQLAGGLAEYRPGLAYSELMVFSIFEYDN